MRAILLRYETKSRTAKVDAREVGMVRILPLDPKCLEPNLALPRINKLNRPHQPVALGDLVLQRAVGTEPVQVVPPISLTSPENIIVLG